MKRPRDPNLHALGHGAGDRNHVQRSADRRRTSRRTRRLYPASIVAATCLVLAAAPAFSAPDDAPDRFLIDAEKNWTEGRAARQRVAFVLTRLSERCVEFTRGIAAASVRAEYEAFTDAGLWHRTSLLEVVNTLYRLASAAYWRNDAKPVRCQSVWETYAFARIELGMEAAEAEATAIGSLRDDGSSRGLDGP